jgi:hypothetical protein
MRKTYLFAFLLAALMVFALPAPSLAAQVSVGISVRVGPPPLPILAVQPLCPGPGYIWTPGYWGYGPDGYYWVPGTWVMAPVGMLWTPGYWGWGNGAYIWHAGYWGPHVGFYGGIHYGFGYDGVGYVGGRWDGRIFRYNTAVSHVDARFVHNTYVDRTVVVNERNVTRVSFNGGDHGIRAVPDRDQRMAMHEHHEAPMAAQMQHEHIASTERGNFMSENHGHPAVVATDRPGEFHGGHESHPAGNSFQPPQHNDHPMNMNNGHASNGSRGEVKQDRGSHENPPASHGNDHGNDRGNDRGNGKDHNGGRGHN